MNLFSHDNLRTLPYYYSMLKVTARDVFYREKKGKENATAQEGGTEIRFAALIPRIRGWYSAAMLHLKFIKARLMLYGREIESSQRALSEYRARPHILPPSAAALYAYSHSPSRKRMILSGFSYYFLAPAAGTIRYSLQHPLFRTKLFLFWRGDRSSKRRGGNYNVCCCQMTRCCLSRRASPMSELPTLQDYIALQEVPAEKSSIELASSML